MRVHCTTEKKATLLSSFIAYLIPIMFAAAVTWVRQLGLKKVQAEAERLVKEGVSPDDIFKALKEQFDEEDSRWIMRRMFPYFAFEVEEGKSKFHRWVKNPSSLVNGDSLVIPIKRGYGLKSFWEHKRR
jgi:hypothetical protein